MSENKKLYSIIGVFPISEIRTGGHKRYIELSRQLVARGYRFIHICRPILANALPGETLPLVPDSVSSFIPPRWWQYRFHIRRGRRLIRELLNAGSQNSIASQAVVLTFGETNYFAASWVARYLKAPLVFALRNNIVDEYERFGSYRRRFRSFPLVQRKVQGWWKRRLERFFTAGSERVVFQSDFDRDNVIGRCPWVQPKARVIANSFRVSWMEREDVRDREPAKLRNTLYLGHLNKRKGIQYLLPAFADLANRGIPITLDLIGFGGLEEWAKSFVSERGLEESIRFLGRIDAPLGYLSKSDLLVVPSLYDSFPNTVLEALYVGTPVIGSDTEGIRTILRHDRLLFPRADSSALARRIRDLVENRDAFREVQELCRDRRRSFDFDWAAAWEAVFNETVASYYR